MVWAQGPLCFLPEFSGPDPSPETQPQACWGPLSAAVFLSFSSCLNKEEGQRSADRQPPPRTPPPPRALAAG